MAADYSLVFTKEKSGATYDSAANGVVVLEYMPVVSFEAKETGSREWFDEDGTDVYDAQDVKLKTVDMSSITCAVSGSGYLQSYKSFIMYLTTGGTLHTMSNSWTGETLQGVRFVKADPEPPYIGKDGTCIMEFKLTVQITKPR